MTPEQRIDRSYRASNAMEEFVSPAIDAARTEYLSALTRLAANEPWETGKLTKLAVAMKVIELVEQHIRAAIVDGEVVSRENARAQQIASIPEFRRNMLQRMGMTK